MAPPTQGKAFVSDQISYISLRNKFFCYFVNKWISLAMAFPLITETFKKIYLQSISLKEYIEEKGKT